LARDSDGNGIADIAYAGDFNGNLWKFNWGSGTMSASTLFTAMDSSNVAQPITAAPLAGKDPGTGTTWVFFGTGQYLHTNDLNSMQVQSWYGIQDTGSVVSGRSDLVQRDILAEGTIGDFAVRVVEEGSISDMANKKGWYMDLVSPVNGAQGERIVVPNRFQGTALIGTTRIPEAEDPCRPSGKGFVMAINPFTGARLDRTFFDVSMDGLFNEADTLVLNGVPTIVSGLGMDSSPNNPIFIEDVMQVGLDDGTTKTIKTQGSAVEAQRMSWRELFN
jgi:type IV pilus assembly protein PilY1